MEVGQFTYGHDRITVRSWGEGTKLKIGNFCSIAQCQVLLGGNHRIDWITTFPFGHIYQDQLVSTPIPQHPVSNGDVIIGNDVWIGENSMIMSGITIGHGAVIAANSHVVKNVDPYTIVGGNPAREIKKRFDNQTIDLLLELQWWYLPLESIQKIYLLLCSQPTVQLLESLIQEKAAGKL